MVREEMSGELNVWRLVGRFAVNSVMIIGRSFSAVLLSIHHGVCNDWTARM